MAGNSRNRYKSRLLTAVFGLGILYLLFLQILIRKDVFFSGDAGLKYLQIRQFVSGNWDYDLQIDAPNWAQNLWKQGFYPFGPPFVYHIGEKWISHFSPLFAALTAPFYWLFGYRGLYVIPLLSTLILWIRFHSAAKSYGLSSQAIAFGLASLVFASNLTVYSAMLWEHTLAVAMAFAGLLVALPGSRLVTKTPRTIYCAFLLGFSAWIRPECACMIGACFGILPLSDLPRRQKWIFVAAALSSLLLLVCFNLLLYKHPLGLQSLQVTEDAYEASQHISVFRLLPTLLVGFLAYCPLSLAAIILPIFGTRNSMAGIDKTARSIWIAIGLFCALSVFILPAPGGKQFGPRYWLPIIPFICLILAFQMNRYLEFTNERSRFAAWMFWGFFSIGIAVNSVYGTIVVYRDYRNRVLPALNYVQTSPDSVIIVDLQWTAQELAASFRNKIFLRTNNGDGLVILCDNLKKAGVQNFLLIKPKSKDHNPTGNASIKTRWNYLGDYGSYSIYRFYIHPI
jgi:hypothetical protein